MPVAWPGLAGTCHNDVRMCAPLDSVEPDTRRARRPAILAVCKLVQRKGAGGGCHMGPGRTGVVGEAALKTQTRARGAAGRRMRMPLPLLLLLHAALAGAEWAVGVRRGASSTAAQSWPMHRIGSVVFPPRDAGRDARARPGPEGAPPPCRPRRTVMITAPAPAPGQGGKHGAWGMGSMAEGRWRWRWRWRWSVERGAC